VREKETTREINGDNASLRKREKTIERVQESDIHIERKGVHVFFIIHRKKERQTG